MAEDAIAGIRAELKRRIRRIEWHAGRASVAHEIDAIRGIAHRNRMLPAATVAHLMESALARGEQGALVHGWVAMLDDAVMSERQDAATSATFAAACQVRLA